MSRLDKINKLESKLRAIQRQDFIVKGFHTPEEKEAITRASKGQEIRFLILCKYYSK